MPEGHTLHRLAGELTTAFGSRVVRLSSPQGRFADEARVLDEPSGIYFEAAEAWGKHLFCRFEGERFIHIHLGLIGRLDVHWLDPGMPPPPPVGQVRLRIAATTAAQERERGAYADLRGAITCALVSVEQRAAIVADLGPDPLREDADPDLAWSRISRSRRTIASLLMDQKIVAGIGNVYRAEILFRHRIDPYRPGTSLRRAQFDAMWTDLVELMQEGVRTGRIDTVRPEHTPEAMGRPARADDHGGEVYVYRRDGQPCLVCGRTVRRAELDGRNLFWCTRCQRAHPSRLQ